MTNAGGRHQKRHRGQIETLRSGALRVKVYAGVDPLSGRRHYLRETVPAGPNAEAEAEKVRIRLINEINERRNPRTSATVNQLLDRHLELLNVDRTTRERYESVVRTHVRPLIGRTPLARARRRDLRRFLQDAADLPITLRRAHVRRTPHQSRTRMHRQVPTGRMQTAVHGDAAKDSLVLESS
ncbi:hypothetical protein [Saccharomonospora saliphila]|uniref:hypothetical protein n=1 Tax=Saccharomonospora saliphila TaxID=369829 RepID=UPI0018DC3CD7|nr:hypothetical protein [Saccharomonospora saliphila]